MSFDYDLVILGGTQVAREAALIASGWHARVALVEPDGDGAIAPGLDELYNQALIHVGHRLHRSRWLTQFERSQEPANQVMTIDWNSLVQWAQLVGKTIADERSPSLLASMGVDVIVGQGEFCRRPYMGVVVNGRVLRSRRYLVATGSRTTIPQIEGLSKVYYLTPESLWRSPVLPSQVVLIGDTPIAVELAQTLTHLGSTVTLAVSGDHLLPQEDREAAHCIQTQLEVEGVRILTQATVSQIRQLDGKIWVQAGTQALETDAVLLATDPQPQVDTLNLAAVDVTHSAQGIQVNRNLQTTHPQIYACGSVIGGYPFPHVARYEAQIALKNALFWPMVQVNYQSIPWAIGTAPTLARVGLTETQAQQRYGKKLQVVQQYLKTSAKAQMQGDTTGFCKLLVTPQETIVGAHFVGMGAEEGIGAIALAMRHHHRLSALITLAVLPPSYTEFIYQSVATWRRQQLTHHPFWQDVLESWFSWRRLS